jgi:hypothetical protein
VQAGGDHGRAGDRIGPFVEGAAGMGSPAMQNNIENGRALAPASKVAIIEAGLIRHAGERATARGIG